MKKILIVASSTDMLELKENKKIPTGYYLDELAVPAQYFMDAGYAVVIATPNGNKPVMDEKSNNVALFDNNESRHKAALKFVVTHPSMQRPKTLKEVAANSKEYVALFVPGGHAPMNDLIQDPELGKILRDFHKDKKVTAFLCHGPVAALSALPRAQEFKRAMIEGDHGKARELAKNWQYSGYKMTAFSNEEEAIAEKSMNGSVLFNVTDALSFAGGFIKNNSPFKPLVIEDRELITGQNPASDLELARAVVRAISEKRSENFSKSQVSQERSDDSHWTDSP